jgi:transcriptional regulator with XRE-family HTH domain
VAPPIEDSQMILLNPQDLSEVMASRDMTGARLGRLTGISRQYISALVTGKRDTCSEDTAKLIEVALGVRRGTLFVPSDVRYGTTPKTNVGAAAAAA